MVAAVAPMGVIGLVVSIVIVSLIKVTASERNGGPCVPFARTYERPVFFCSDSSHYSCF